MLGVGPHWSVPSRRSVPGRDRTSRPRTRLGLIGALLVLATACAIPSRDVPRLDADAPVTIADFADEDANLPRAIDAVEAYVRAYAGADEEPGVAVGPAAVALEVRAALERTRGRGEVESPYSGIDPLEVRALGEDFVLVEGGVAVDRDDNELTQFEVAVVDGNVAVRGYLVDGEPLQTLVADTDGREGSVGGFSGRVEAVGRDTDDRGVVVLTVRNGLGNSVTIDVGRSRVTTDDGPIFPTSFAGTVGPIPPGRSSEIVIAFEPGTTPQGVLGLVVRDSNGPRDQVPVVLELGLPETAAG